MNYSIDDMVRESLRDGSERHNLGAWANMERMLDGKDPYAPVPAKRSNIARKYLPLILLFIGLSAGGSYLLMDHLTVPKTDRNTDNTAIRSNNSPSVIQPSTPEMANPVQPSEHIANTYPDRQPEGFNKKQQKVSSSDKPIASLASIGQRKEGYSVHQKKKGGRKNISAVDPENTQKASFARHSSGGSGVQKQSDIKEMGIKSKQAIWTQMTAPVKGLPEAFAHAGPDGTLLETTQWDTLAKYEVHPSHYRDANGKMKWSFDTLKGEDAIIQRKVLSYKETNPRYVELSPEDEARVNKQTGVVLASNNSQDVLEAVQKETIQEIQDQSAKTISAEEKAKAGAFRNFYRTTLQKLERTSIRIKDKQIPIYPGMTVGVNASIFSKKNNFGGFNGGFTAFTPLNRTFSLMAELRYFFKNNAGYTVNDYSHTIKALDSIQNTAKTVYMYQVDSNAIGYNFKNFSTLELPIMLKAHAGHFNFYGGPVLAYSFPLSVTRSTKNYAVQWTDSIPNNASYVFRTDVSPLYTNQDFRSRFGVGYTVGIGYNFNANLYLDLRLSQTLWDNAKTATSKEISKTFFRIPGIQFSLGYHFRKFERE